MVTQLSSKYDKELNALERKLAEAVKARDAAEQRYDFLFQQVFSIFDRSAGEGNPASFICEDGFKLARLVPQMSPVVDSEKVRQVIAASSTDLIANAKLWRRITEVKRVVNQDKLAKAIKESPNLALALEHAEAIKVPVRKPTRYRQPASKHEVQAVELTAKEGTA